MSKETSLSLSTYGKRDLLSGKRDLQYTAYLRSAQVSEETYSYDKRDLSHGKRDLQYIAYLRSAQASEETYSYDKRDLSHGKRDLQHTAYLRSAYPRLGSATVKRTTTLSIIAGTDISAKGTRHPYVGPVIPVFFLKKKI